MLFEYSSTQVIYTVRIILVRWALVGLVVMSVSSCSVSRRVVAELEQLEQLHQYHLGVSVREVESGKELVRWQDNRYFNPASNTKIYTLYACLNALGDSLPGLLYRVSEDTLFFQGTGDPSFLHQELPESRAYRFLKESDRHLVYYEGVQADSRFGTGWAWDDYNDYYQVEKSIFPMYGNVVRLTGDPSSILRADPEFWYSSLKPDSVKPGIIRDEFANVFRFSPRPLPAQLRQDLPVRTSPELTVQLLNFSLGREVVRRSGNLPPPFSTCYSVPADTVYKRMMYDSDNMMAEQLLYTYATQHELPFVTGEAIEHATNNYFTDMPDYLIWRDASGLSRYNLFTPRSTTEVLSRMIRDFPKERVLSLFPKAGATGTIKYLLRESPARVYAKSGSFSNNYCLSGYLYSKKGKLLVFSVMHNNFSHPIRDMQRLTEAIVTKLYQSY